MFLERILCCFINDAVGVKLIDLYNVDNVCWESDYPHSDSSWPDGPEILEPLLAELSDAQINKITHENAMRHYQFDPFSVRSKEQCTVAALRAEATDVDVVTRVGRPSDESDLEAWKALTESRASAQRADALSLSGRQPDAASSARRTSTRARCARYAGVALRSSGGSVPSAACSAASANDAPSASAALDRRRAERRAAHVHEGDVRRAVRAHRDRADRRPVLSPPVELLVREAARADLGDADLGEQLVGAERGLEEVDEQVGRGDGAIAGRTTRGHAWRRARAAPPGDPTRDRRARPSRRSCRGGAPAGRRSPRRRPGSRRTRAASRSLVASSW